MKKKFSWHTLQSISFKTRARRSALEFSISKNYAQTYIKYYLKSIIGITLAFSITGIGYANTTKIDSSNTATSNSQAQVIHQKQATQSKLNNINSVNQATNSSDISSKKSTKTQSSSNSSVYSSCSNSNKHIASSSDSNLKSENNKNNTTKDLTGGSGTIKNNSTINSQDTQCNTVISDHKDSTNSEIDSSKNKDKQLVATSVYEAVAQQARKAEATLDSLDQKKATVSAKKQSAKPSTNDLDLTQISSDNATVLQKTEAPYVDLFLDELKYLLQPIDNSIPLAPVLVNPPLSAYALLDRQQLDFANPINFNLYSKNIYRKPSFLGKVVNFYYSLFNETAIKNESQIQQLPPLQFNNNQPNIYQVNPNYKQTISDQFITPNSSFNIKIGNVNIQVFGLGSDAVIKEYSKNIYSLAAINVTNALKTINPTNVDTSLRSLYNIQQLTEKALEAYGLYGATVKVTKLQPNQVKVTIVPGTPVTMNGKSTIIIRGQGTGFTSYQNLNNLFSFPGEILNASKYQNAKDYITNTALDNGFFNGSFLQNSLYVNKESNYAYWKLDYYTGPRFKISSVDIQGSQINKQLVENSILTKPNDYYSYSQVSESLHYLRASKWFSQVGVDPIVDHKNQTVKLVYKVDPNSANEINLAVGYNSFEGLRGKVQYIRNYINSFGSSLDVRSYLSRVKQSVVANYKYPYFKDPSFKTFNFGVSFLRELQPALNTFTRSFVNYINFTRTPINNWQFSSSIYLRKDLWNYLGSSFSTNLTYIDLSFVRYSLNTNVALHLRSNLGTNKILTNSVEYNYASLNFSHIFQVTTNDSISLDLQLDKIWTNNFYKIPPGLRLYTGGPNSVRGYAFKSISNYHGVEGIGGLASNNFQLEYLRTIIPNLKGVVFVDGGQSSSKIRWHGLHYGAGIGVRYYLPVGYVNFDVAYPIGHYFNWKKISFYLSINASL